MTSSVLTDLFGANIKLTDALTGAIASFCSNTWIICKAAKRSIPYLKKQLRDLGYSDQIKPLTSEASPA